MPSLITLFARSSTFGGIVRPIGVAAASDRGELDSARGEFDRPPTAL
jgi:hypothetical protein